MYRKNTLKQRLVDGEKVLGCWTMLGHPQVVEILSLAGFDYLVLDQEHGLGDPSTLAAQLHAMSATPTVGVVRVPWNDHVYLKRVLDMGAEAVLIPSIDTADEARAAVAACLYPTRGRRGTAASSVRASSYGMAPDYVATCADNLLIACQIESAKAVENIDEILAVDGIDLIFIGPFDLSATVGQMGNLKHPEVARLIGRAEERDQGGAPSDGHRSASRLHVEGHVRARLPVRERGKRHRAAARRRARRRQGVPRALPQELTLML